MEVRIGADGVPEPRNAVQFVVAETREDGRVVRHFMCLSCRELLEAVEGEELVHVCEGEGRG